MMTIKTVHDVLYDFREAENELMNVRMVFLNVSEGFEERFQTR